MNIDDFIKLPAREAADLYRASLDTGDAAEASRLHQVYFETHRVRLSADRQVLEATEAHQPRTAGPPHSGHAEQSTIRRIGIALLVLGIVIAAFSAAADVGGPSLACALAFTSAGFMLWLAGIVEDRLIEIRRAITNAPG